MNVAQQIAPGVLYFPRFIDEPDAALVDVMGQVSFTQRERNLYGRRVMTPRLEAWHGPTAYRFGGSALPARELPPVLQALAIRCEAVIDDARFDSCLANLYRDGSDSVAWHADDELEMGDPIIASISLGAKRDFLLRRKDAHRSKVSVALEHGSLLVMLRGVQAAWEHCVPRRSSCTERRVNLTFRDCTR